MGQPAKVMARWQNSHQHTRQIPLDPKISWMVSDAPEPVPCCQTPPDSVVPAKVDAWWFRCIVPAALPLLAPADVSAQNPKLGRGSSLPPLPARRGTRCSRSIVFPLFHGGSPLMLIVCRQSLAESVAVLWFICWLLLSCPDQWRKCFDVNELQTISLNTEQGLASLR